MSKMRTFYGDRAKVFLLAVAYALFAGCGGDDDAPVVCTSNCAPVLTSIGNQAGTVNEQLQFTVAATDVDADDQIAYSADGSAGTIDPFMSNPPATFDATTGVFEWTPAEARDATVTFTATDSSMDALTDQETITIAVQAADINDAPVLASIGNQAATVNEQLQFTVIATDEDAGDQITYSADGSAGAINPFTTDPAATFDASTGVFTWTPSTAGGATVVFTATDNGMNPLSDQETITITVQDAESNNPPVLASIGNQTATVNEQLQFTVIATDEDAGDQVTYSADGSAGAINPFTTDPAATLDASTGVFSWTPAATGAATVTFTATDNGVGPLSAQETITITVEGLAADAVAGAALYAGQGCGGCHGADGGGGLFKSVQGENAAELAAAIANVAQMAGYSGLTETEIANLGAYMESLR